jgi:general secretion pathway protein I
LTPGVMCMSHPERSNGFTLIELLVALAVFSLAALALIKLDTTTIRSSQAVSDKLMARIVANNLAIEALTDPVAPTLGAGQGSVANGGRNFLWVRNATRGDVGAGLVRVDVAVTSPDGQLLAQQTVVRGL